jgi:hypothetical protein
MGSEAVGKGTGKIMSMSLAENLFTLFCVLLVIILYYQLYLASITQEELWSPL